MIDLVTKGGLRRVLVVGAHPDDAEVGAGGTLARLARAGADVTVAVVSVPQNYEQRAEEARRGAAALGARCHLIAREAGRMEDTTMYELVRSLDSIVADVRPDLVFVHSQSDLHYDHALSTRAAMSALRRSACNIFAFSSSYELNAQARFIGQCFVDVSETLETKIAAIRAHASQLDSMDLEGTKNYARAMGKKCGAEAAEVFELLRLIL
jgi:LmbE family N-acetylglucosaminyl deacetylase